MTDRPIDLELRVAAWSTVAAIVLGMAVIALTVLGVTELRGPAPAPDGRSPAATLLIAGTFAGPVVAAAAAWLLLAPLHSPYRRGALAMVSAFATVLAMLLCIPVYQLFGQSGLAGLAAVGAGLFAWASTRARRLGRLA